MDDPLFYDSPVYRAIDVRTEKIYNVIYYMVIKDYNLIYGLVKVSTGVLKLVKLSVCNALNGKLKYKR